MVGLAVGFAHVVQDNPVAGDHVYDVPPVALKPVDDPAQIATLEPALIVGNEFTETVTLAVLEQPLAFVPVTV